MRIFPAILLSAALLLPALAQTPRKPPITLDEFMNASEILDARISPNGEAAVLAVSTPDWQRNRFDKNLWLWQRQAGKLIQLTHSSHDSSPQFSPDGGYVAFISDRPIDAAGTGTEEKDKPGRVWLIAVSGGEPIPLYRENLDAHAFAWSSDG